MTELLDSALISSARRQAASRSSRPWYFFSPITPRQAPYPCWGCLRSRMIASQRAAAFGPIRPAEAMICAGVCAAILSWAGGMCSRSVLWRRLPDVRACAATGAPLWKNSTARSLILAPLPGSACLHAREGDLLLQEAVRDRVVMAIDVDVIVQRHGALAPFGVFVGRVRQRLQRRAVDLPEELPAARPEMPRHLAVQRLQRLADRFIQLLEGMEAPIAQARENPALDELNRNFDLALVARLQRPRRDDGGVVVLRHLRIGPVDLRVVEARLRHAGLQVVGNHGRGNAAEIFEAALVRRDPIGQLLRPGRLRVGQVRGAEGGHEDGRLTDFTRLSVDHLDGGARVIHKQRLACGMVLAHDRREAPFPCVNGAGKSRSYGALISRS